MISQEEALVELEEALEVLGLTPAQATKQWLQSGYFFGAQKMGNVWLFDEVELKLIRDLVVFMYKP